MTEKVMTIAPSESYWRAASEFLPATFSQISGLPSWVQGMNYLDCPKCCKNMSFIAQLKNGELEEYAEGDFLYLSL